MRYNITYADKLVIGGHLYRIDLERNGLQDMILERNFMHYGQMQAGTRQLSFVYNANTRNIATEKDMANEKQGHLYPVRIPTEVARMKHELSLQAYDRLNMESFDQQYGFMKLGQRYVERHLGILPQLVVGHDRYRLDLAQQQLCSVTDRTKYPLTVLNEAAKNGEIQQECLYDPAQKRFLHVNTLDEQHISAVYLLRLPGLKAMDPVGAALLEGKKDFHYLNRYPLHEQINAEVYKFYQGLEKKLYSVNHISKQPSKVMTRKHTTHKL